MRFKVKVTKTQVFINGTPAKRRYTGGSRRVFSWKNYIIKIEWEKEEFGTNRSFFHQCRNEYRIWKRLSKKDKKIFVPILKYKHTKEYDYVIQPKIKIPNSQNKIHEDIYNKIVESICNKYKLGDLFPDLDCNWKVVSKNKVIIWDYGV